MKLLDLFRPKRPPVSQAQYDYLMRILNSQLQQGVPVPIGQTLTEYITEGFAFNPSVYSLISLRATAAKGIPWLVYQIKDKRKLRQYDAITSKGVNLEKTLKLKEESLEEVDGTPLNSLLKRPNEKQTFSEFLEELWLFRDTVGNAYWYNITNPVTGLPLEMHTLPADRVRIIGGEPIQPIAGYTVDLQYYNGMTLEPDKVVHWKYPNLMYSAAGCNLYGMPPLKAAAMIIAQDNMATRGQSAAFLNEGLKGFITGTQQTEIDFTAEQAYELQKRLADKTGYKNNRKLAFSRAPLQFVKVGESPIDLGVQQAREYNRELLCNIFRVHPSLLASDASTLNNLKEARRALITTSVLPDLDTFKAILNNRIASAFGSEFYLDYDLMAISEIQDDLQVLAKTLKTMDWVTINEKRAATQYGRYDNEAADKLYSAIGLQELGEFDTGFDEIDKHL